jgi:hypothetical protein
MKASSFDPITPFFTNVSTILEVIDKSVEKVGA